MKNEQLTKAQATRGVIGVGIVMVLGTMIITRIIIKYPEAVILIFIIGYMVLFVLAVAVMKLMKRYYLKRSKVK